MSGLDTGVTALIVVKENKSFVSNKIILFV